MSGVIPPTGEALPPVTGGIPGAPAVGPAMRLELVELPLDQIVTDEAERDPSASLLEDIERDGPLGAIDVRARPDGRYDLVDGSRRLACARRLGQPTIPAIVEPAAAARLPRDLRALLLNTQRQNLQQLQIGIRARRLIEQEGWTQAELARRIHRSRSALCAMLKVVESPDLVTAIREEGLAFGAARALVTLPPDDRRPLVEELTAAALREGRFPSVRQVEARVRRCRGQAAPLPVAPQSAPALLERLQSEGAPIEICILRGPQRAVRLTLVLTEEDALCPAGLPREPAAADPPCPAPSGSHGETIGEAPGSGSGAPFPRGNARRRPAG